MGKAERSEKIKNEIFCTLKEANMWVFVCCAADLRQYAEVLLSGKTGRENGSDSVDL